MPHREAHEIYRRWIAKGDRCDKTSLDGAFDRFFSYFVAYNALYFISAGKVHAANDRGSSYIGDKSASTEAVVDFLGADRLWERLEEVCGESVNALHQGLKDQKFGVSVHNKTREPNPVKDKELAESLGSTDNEVRCKALLTVVYYVRCNMFHGQKLPTHVQKEPLNHASKVIRTVVTYLASRLDAA